MSGFTPGVTLRNTFSRESSPKASEELDCSPEKRVEWASVSRSYPGSRWNSRASSVEPVETLAARSNARSQPAIASRSWTAS